MSNPNQPAAAATVTELPDDSSLLNFVHQKRVAYAQKLEAQNGIYEKAGMAAVYAKLLSDMDGVALSRMKIKVEDKAAANMTNVSSQIADILYQITNDNTTGSGGSVKTLTEAIPDPVLVPGETDTAPGQMDIDSFNVAMSSKA